MEFRATFKQEANKRLILFQRFTNIELQTHLLSGSNKFLIEVLLKASLREILVGKLKIVLVPFFGWIFPHFHDLEPHLT